ncbi:MAG: methylenetetrahydrofolate--tRNA-(uracil(54)-C(5))-methyltransferase (FADH(2)-oxidizing) TrmFO [Myxococcales bacterium]|nr:methylenetetrahydrofolate--tRNA-(uracil(54)-C(5))-methyltransferase (FADH(2)-oxidizing) TrmFO [Myxococcales bacterium]
MSGAPDVTVVGGGLAGSECAFQLAERGLWVRLIEQKPQARSAAHFSDGLAELVCSNSLRAAAIGNAVGLLKEEMRRCGSLILACAEATAVPAGGALAVDRAHFSAAVTARIDGHERIERVAGVLDAIPDSGPVVLATGPMTAPALAADLARCIGAEHLAYYDSIAPIVIAESIDHGRVFAASRYDKGDGDDYLNCPLSEPEYRAFVAALIEADTIEGHACEPMRFFEGCLPIEEMAARGPDTLAYGPMKPVGLYDPATGRRPFAVVQLRREDAAGTAYNLVGFQTRLRQPEQRRVFAMIPGLESARYERFGSVHRNTFVDAPQVLDDMLALRARPDVYLAGQITGVEGYVESAACGLVVGLRLAAKLQGGELSAPPETTALGALMGHLRRPREDFQPSNVVFSMFPPIEGLRGGRRGRRARREALAERALSDLEAWREAGATGVQQAS